MERDARNAPVGGDVPLDRSQRIVEESAAARMRDGTRIGFTLHEHGAAEERCVLIERIADELRRLAARVAP